jgi:hypothetical protein
VKALSELGVGADAARDIFGGNLSRLFRKA